MKIVNAFKWHRVSILRIKEHDPNLKVNSSKLDENHAQTIDPHPT